MEREKYILVDFENVHPAHLDRLRDRGFKIRIFLGSTQERIPLSIVKSLQVFGTALEYVRTCGMGPNALDFYIAFFLGRKSLEVPNARFFIISKDTGFDPLLRHLSVQGISCRRVNYAEEISREEASMDAMQALPPDEMLHRVIAHLSRPMTRPRTPKTLRSAIHALFGKKLRPAQIEDLVATLKENGFLLQETPRIVYRIDTKATAEESQQTPAVVSGPKEPEPEQAHIVGLMN